MLKRNLIGLFRSFEQSGDKAKYPGLETRIFKQPKDKLWEELIYVLNKEKYKIVHEVKSVGEIIIEKRTVTGRVQDVTITLYDINPIKTAIDIYSASRGSIGDLGSNYRTILEIFKLIDQKFAEYKE
ncbi:DUF1499 domain-containing protein [Chengkuizengella axinellae]|uniref:DUF1499 domain-containing protein n=1 Tax=Chengkuizengella axinellae TaxID=3064388 RepID=A0ABT9IYZ5_9BACL|nr:DUF1499 domain-containing protein [Chengkuizengella sp. 2205SS18-9]MDP5274542.1 DUF1499 domain-containing protein [Chengkuizengella sp. 2205SS18-9]